MSLRITYCSPSCTRYSFILTTLGRVSNGQRMISSDFVLDRVCYGPSYPGTATSLRVGL